MKEDLGRLAGVGMIRPAACRCRLMEATDTLSWWWCSRCQAMVCGPLSRPLLASVSRSPMIRSMVVCGRRAGLVCGRRERGSNAASPSARYRVTSRDIQLWETPYSRATSDWLRPSTMTAVMTKRAFDTRRRWPTHLFRCLATPHSDVLKHHTVSPTEENRLRPAGASITCESPAVEACGAIRFSLGAPAGALG